MIKKLMFMACVGLIGLVGRDGDKGDVGPAGPKGDTGAAGPAGPAGAAGENGIGALSITSKTVQSDSATGGYILGKTNLTATDTAAINSGTTVLFIQSGDFWYAQPGIVKFGDQWSKYQFSTTVRNNTFYVVITPESWSEQQPTPPVRTFQSIRAVVIPATKMRLNAGVDLTNYNAVVSAFGIKESDFVEVQ